MDTAPGSDRPDPDDPSGDPMPDGPAAVDGPEGPAALDGSADGPSDDSTDPVGDGPADGSDPLRFSKWMKRSATGAILTGITLGLQQALEPTKKDPAFMIEASGQPDDPDNPIRLQFDPDSPEDTVAYIRRPTDGAGSGSAATPEGAHEASDQDPAPE